jgi:hypothetical protein
MKTRILPLDSKAHIHSNEESLIKNSLLKINCTLDSFPFKEFKAFSNIREDSQLETTDPGELIATKKNLFRKIFPKVPPTVLISQYLLQAENTLQELGDLWPNMSLLSAFPTQIKQALRNRFANLLKLSINALRGLIALEKNYLKNYHIVLEIKIFQSRMSRIVEDLGEYQEAIPSITQLLNDAEEFINSLSFNNMFSEESIDSIDLDNIEFSENGVMLNSLDFESIRETFIFFDEILKICEQSPNESIFIREKTEKIKNQLIDKITWDYKKHIIFVKKLLEIETYDDCQKALEICENIQKGCQFLDKRAQSIREKATKLQAYTLSILPKIREAEDSRDDEIHRVRELLEKPSSSINVINSIPGNVVQYNILPYLTSVDEKKCDLRELTTWPLLNKHFYSMFKPNLNDIQHKLKKRLQQLLQAVVYGEKNKVNEILKASSTELRRYLLAAPMEVTDYSGRRFEMTALQLTLYALDVGRQKNINEGMTKMIIDFLKDFDDGKNMICHQIQQQFPKEWKKEKEMEENKAALQTIFKAIADSKENDTCEESIEIFRNYFTLKYKNVIRCGNNTMAEMLDESYSLAKKNSESFGRYNNHKNKIVWKHVIGWIQRYVTVPYAYAFCYGIDKALEAEELPRSLEFKWQKDLPFFPLLEPGLGLGYKNAIRDGIRLEHPSVLSAWICPRFLSKLIKEKNAMLNSICIIYQSPEEELVPHSLPQKPR